MTPLEVSAAQVRARLREGRTVRYLLPEGVHDAIVKSGVYGQDAGQERGQEGQEPPAGAPRAGIREDR